MAKPAAPAAAAGTGAAAPDKKGKKKTFKKKERKHVPLGIVHIQASFNNTIVTIADQAGIFGLEELRLARFPRIPKRDTLCRAAGCPERRQHGARSRRAQRRSARQRPGFRPSRRFAPWPRPVLKFATLKMLRRFRTTVAVRRSGEGCKNRRWSSVLVFGKAMLGLNWND